MNAPNKQKRSNKVRLKSLKQRNAQEKQSQLIIQSALHNINASEKKNYIKFEDSDDEELVEVNGFSSSVVAKTKDVLGLENDEEEITLKPRFEGKSAHKLMEIQSKVGMDERFKIDQRFVDSDDDDDNDEDHAVTDMTDDVKKNLAVLAKLLGSTALSKRKIFQFADPTLKRYDPTKQGHVDMEVTPKQEETVVKPKRRKKQTKNDKMPEVAKNRFYELSANELINAFGKNVGKNESVPCQDDSKKDVESFSLLKTFGRDSDNSSDENDANDPAEYTVEELNTNQKKIQNIFKPNSFIHDSTDSEQSDEENVVNDGAVSEHEESDEENVRDEKMVIEEPEPPKIQRKRFFLFSKDDPRLTEGPLRFCSNKSPEQIREEWLEVKDELKRDYKQKHRNAIRALKSQKRKNKEQQTSV